MQQSRQRTRANYDRLSRWYDLLTGGSEGKISEAGIALLELQEGARVLEIGCGTGKNLVQLAQRVAESGAVTGIDLSRGMVKKAKARLGKSKSFCNVNLTLGDAVDLPFSAGYFDVIYMAFTLELFNIKEIPKVLDEAWRLLTEGGHLCVIALAKTESPSLAERGYIWMHGKFPHFLDCQPIYTRCFVKSHFDIVNHAISSIWGLPVDTVIAVKRTH